ncbi:UNVERIFIED_CONTAM: hypothetical protein GTU68_001785 [Idotea baltica]|nr:hypothetical protein [Idotea baltica]
MAPVMASSDLIASLPLTMTYTH